MERELGELRTFFLEKFGHLTTKEIISLARKKGACDDVRKYEHCETPEHILDVIEASDSDLIWFLNKTSSFVNANLRGSDLRGLNLSGVNLRQVNLLGSGLKGKTSKGKILVR